MLAAKSKGEKNIILWIDVIKSNKQWNCVRVNFLPQLLE